MALPSQYFDPYDRWLRVGLALHNTSDKLFLTWMLFSAKSAKFAYTDIMKHYDTWCGFPYSPDGLTRRSIMYWAKNDCLEEYTRIRMKPSTTSSIKRFVMKQPTTLRRMWIWQQFYIRFSKTGLYA